MWGKGRSHQQLENPPPPTPATPWLGSVALPVASPSPLSSRNPPTFIMLARDQRTSYPSVNSRPMTAAPESHRQSQGSGSSSGTRPRTQSLRPLKGILKQSKPIPQDTSIDIKSTKGKGKGTDAKDGRISPIMKAKKDGDWPPSRIGPGPRKYSDSSSSTSSSEASTGMLARWKSSKAPLKMETVTLQWPLQTWGPDRKKKTSKTIWDIAFDPDDPNALNLKCLDPRLGRRHMKSDEKDLPVSTHCIVTHMTIQCILGPLQWSLKIHCPHGIKCSDVFTAIHKKVHKHLTMDDYRRLDPDYITFCHNAFVRRCKRAPGITDVEMKIFRRVDLLNGKRAFGGLKQTGDDEWTLVLKELNEH